MPRDTVQRTNRQEVSLNDPRPVQLQSTRRFFTSNGNDRANREARALADAFGAGADFLGERAVQQDQEGFDQARADSAAGGERDVDEKNQGYHRAWDQLDAENDLNVTESELPEVLRGADWENLPVDAVQDVINQYLKENFGGLDGESTYAEAIVPGLQALEDRLMTERRDLEVQNIKQDQRVKIFENTEKRFELNGQFDYAYLADQTNIFFDGAEKRVAYWETLMDVAIDRGAPELLENSPERFGVDGTGDPTGKTDPIFQDELRQATDAARRKQASLIKAQQDSQEVYNEQMRYGAQLNVLQAVARGENGVAETSALASIPGTTLADISAANNFARTWRDDIDEEAGDLAFIAPTWNMVHDGSTTQQALWDSLMRGDFGGGQQSIDTFNAMATKLRSIQESDQGDDGPDKTFWRSQINKLYAPALGGLLQAVDPLTHRVNLAAHSYYQAQLDEGDSPDQAYQQTQTRFDPIISEAATLNKEELNVERRRTQGAFEAEAIVTTEALKAVGTGAQAYTDIFGGVRPAVVTQRLEAAYDSGELTEEEVTNVMMNLY